MNSLYGYNSRFWQSNFIGAIDFAITEFYCICTGLCEEYRKQVPSCGEIYYDWLHIVLSLLRIVHWYGDALNLLQFIRVKEKNHSFSLIDLPPFKNKQSAKEDNIHQFEFLYSYMKENDNIYTSDEFVIYLNKRKVCFGGKEHNYFFGFSL